MNSTTTAVVYHTSLEGGLTGKRMRQCGAVLHCAFSVPCCAVQYCAVPCGVSCTVRCGSVRCCPVGSGAVPCSVPLRCGGGLRFCRGAIGNWRSKEKHQHFVLSSAGGWTTNGCHFATWSCCFMEIARRKDRDSREGRRAGGGKGSEGGGG